jgi:hypothetical protein
VTVLTPGGTSNGASYTYAAIPTLTSVSPSTGPESAGNTVTLAGAALTGATAVSFGGVQASSFTVDSDTQVTATVPAGTGTASVTVTTPGGTSGGVSYTYAPIPA